MTDKKLEELIANHHVDVIMDVPQLTRAWLARGMPIEEMMTQLLYYLGTHEERHETIDDQFVDLERRQEQSRSEIAALRQDV